MLVSRSVLLPAPRWLPRFWLLASGSVAASWLAWLAPVARALEVQVNPSNPQVGETILVWIQVDDPSQRLGTVGATGASTGPHLHWGLYVHGEAIAPVPWRYQGVE